MWTGHRIAAVVAITFATLSAPALAQAQGKWVKLAPVPVPAEEFTPANAAGKIYLIGGNSIAGKTSPGLVQEYDTATDKWTKKKDMPIRANHMTAVGLGDKIYVFGGQENVEGGQIPIDKAWEYNPAADSWKALAPMPTARTAATAVEFQGKIYVMGGNSVQAGLKLAPMTNQVPQRSLATNEVYDPATNKWETKREMPTARNHVAVGVVNGKIYLIGGRIGGANLASTNNISLVEVYDPVADTWGPQRANMPFTRTGVGYATRQGKIYIAGGENVDPLMHAVYGYFQVYDPATNAWDELPPITPPRHGVNMAAIGNRIYVISGHIAGGGDGGEEAHSDVNSAFEFDAR